MDLFQLLSSPDVNWWTGVVWITCGLLWCLILLIEWLISKICICGKAETTLCWDNDQPKTKDSSSISTVKAQIIRTLEKSHLQWDYSSHTVYLWAKSTIFVLN